MCNGEKFQVFIVSSIRELPSSTQLRPEDREHAHPQPQCWCSWACRQRENQPRCVVSLRCCSITTHPTDPVAALSTTLSTAALDKHPQSKQRGITLDLGFSAVTVQVNIKHVTPLQAHAHRSSSRPTLQICHLMPSSARLSTVPGMHHSSAPLSGVPRLSTSWSSWLTSPRVSKPKPRSAL